MSGIGKMRIISEQLTYDKWMREISSTPILYFICITILEIFYRDIQAQYMSHSARIQTGTMHRNWLLMPFLEHSNGCPNIASLLCTMAIFLRKLVSIFDWLNGHLSWRCWPIQKQFYLSHTVAWKGDFISLESSEYQLGAHPCIYKSLMTLGTNDFLGVISLKHFQKSKNSFIFNFHEFFTNSRLNYFVRILKFLSS